MEDDEQHTHLSDFLQLQFIYHQTAIAFVSHISDNLMLSDAIPPTTQPMEQQVEYVQIDNVPTDNEPENGVVEIFDDPQQEQAMDNAMVVDEEQSNPIVNTSEEPLVKNKGETTAAQPPAVVFVDEGALPEASKTAEVDALFPRVDDWDDESEKGASALPTPKAKVQSELENAPAFHEFSQFMEPLFSLSEIAQVDEEALHAVIKVLVSTAERMQKRGFSLIEFTPMIIALVQRQLDITSQSMWHWYQKGKPLTLDLFMEFLTERVKNILPKELPFLANPFSRPPSSCGSDGQQAGPSNAGGTGAIPKTRILAGRNDHAFFHGEDSASEGRKEKRAMKCPRCEANHPLHRCAQFSALTWRARLETVKQAKLCNNCFSNAHKTKDCKKGPCKKCGVKHNSLLCPVSSFFDPKTKL